MHNGYFQIVAEQYKYGILFVPASDGGEQVSVSEVESYLCKYNFNYHFDDIIQAVSSDEEVFVELGLGDCPAISLDYNLTVSDDNMEAVARIYPASETGKSMSYREFVIDLGRKGISYGICEETIKDAFIQNLYVTDIIVAKGQPVREGHDATIEYFFNTDPKIKPTMNEDGSVDFFHLNTVNNCKAGDTLARLYREDPGEAGMTIYSGIVKPRLVKRKILNFGRNLEIIEDGTLLVSKVNGHVTLVDGKVFVSDVLEVENVDTSTGNIEYEGSVMVSGNVQSNFSVQAGGNIIVKGLVEGAKLDAGGDIIITRGMAGMGKGELKAGGNVVAKFFENATVFAGGYITTESILHSTVMAEGEITVDGRKGFIAGGNVCSAHSIDAKTLGSHLGTATIVEVGVQPAMKNEYAELQKQIEEVTKEISSMDPIMVTFSEKHRQGVDITMDQLKYLENLVRIREVRSATLHKASVRAESLRQKIEQNTNAQVIVRGEVFPGVKVVIGEVSNTVQSNTKYCRFMKIRGDVKMTSI